MVKVKKDNKYQRKYTDKQIDDAIHAVKNGMPQRTASKTYGVPRSTIHGMDACVINNMEETNKTDKCDNTNKFEVNSIDMINDNEIDNITKSNSNEVESVNAEFLEESNGIIAISEAGCDILKEIDLIDNIITDQIDSDIIDELKSNNIIIEINESENATENCVQCDTTSSLDLINSNVTADEVQHNEVIDLSLNHRKNCSKALKDFLPQPVTPKRKGKGY